MGSCALSAISYPLWLPAVALQNEIDPFQKTCLAKAAASCEAAATIESASGCHEPERIPNFAATCFFSMARICPFLELCRSKLSNQLPGRVQLRAESVTLKGKPRHLLRKCPRLAKS